MKITFGLSLDTHSYPPLATGRIAFIGEMRCGPLGLLQLLETRLGLTGVWEDEPYRVEIYRQRLMAADNGNRFYSRSIKADAQGVAQTLLGWRDELLFSGWDFTAEESTPARLTDLSAVETVPVLTVPQVPWGLSERFREVISMLPATPLGIAEIHLVEPKSIMGEQWTKLVDKLSESGVTICQREVIKAKGKGDLAALQSALHTGKKVNATGDGSLLILRGASECELADLLSAWHLSTECVDRLFIIPPGDRTMGRVIVASGAPALGVSSYSPLRPILQILPLFCELLWEPLDPYRLLELLTLPVTPIPKIASRKLAEAVAASPGIGGKAWKTALAEIETLILEDADNGPDRLKWVRKEVTSWLEGDRYLLSEGVPNQALADLCKRLAAWAGGRELKDDEADSQLKALAAQAAHLARLAEGAPENKISQPQLRKLLKMVSGEGQALGEIAGAGHASWVTTPEAILDPVSELVWFGFTRGNSATYRRSPWLKKESVFLQSKGISLPSPDTELSRHVIGYECAILAATDRLVLCVPDVENGATAETHPLYDRLSVILGDSIRSVEVKTSDWLTGDSRIDDLETVPVVARNVPVPTRYWKLPENNTIGTRSAESYSSLDTLFNEPYKWVLSYGAKLREGAIQSIGSRNSIMGTLSHRLFEEMFVKGEDCSSWTQAAIDKKVDGLLKILLSTEGAVFLLPGYVSELQSLLRKLKRAAWAMAGHIRENGWTVVGTEYGAKGKLGNQDVEGSVDLLLGKSDGTLAVVDLKWGQSKYLRTNLLENRAIQLALYAHMLKSKKKMPHVAYFSFSEAVLIAPDHKAFKSARLAEIPQGESLETLIVAMGKTFNFRRGQLDCNNIEVPVAGTIANPAVLIPTDVLVDPEWESDPAEYRALVGWEEGNRA